MEYTALFQRNLYLVLVNRASLKLGRRYKKKSVMIQENGNSKLEGLKEVNQNE